MKPPLGRQPTFKEASQAGSRIGENESETIMDEDQALHMSRRDVLLAAAAGTTALALPVGEAGAAEAPVQPPPVEARGIVYAQDGNMRQGLPGVLVSNGRDIAVTDADGRYRLPVTAEDVVFVIKPAGFMTPVDRVTQIPQFSRIHQPDGSPTSLDLTFPGVAPTGPLPASIDFELHRQDEPTAFEVILFTDTQPETDAELDFVRDDVINPLASTGARFAINAGDIMFDDLSLYDRYNRMAGTIGVPWYVVGGNHDLNFEAPGRRYSRETFKRVFGPTHYAFAYAEAVFIMLDDVEYLGADPSRPGNAGKYRGQLDADQLQFIANLLPHVPDDKLIVLVLHIPLDTYSAPNAPDNSLTNRADLFNLFKDRRFTVSFSGHTHTTEHHYFTEADGWPSAVPHHHHVMTAVSGSWWSGPYDHRGVAVADSRDGSPNGFHMLRVEGNNYRTWFVPAKEPDRRQLRLSVESRFHGGNPEIQYQFRPGQLLSGPIGKAAVPATTIVANVFDGGPKTEVTLRIGDRDPLAMVRHPVADPFIVDLYARNDAVKKPWVKPIPSSHTWTVRLPPDLAAGAHRLTATARTEYGATVTGSIVLEVVG